MNITNIPKEMQEKKQWVLWRLETKGGKQTKVPYSIDGKKAKVNDPATWSSFDSVTAIFQNGGYNGIGFVFDGDFVGIDFDSCLDDSGKPNEEAAAWVKDFSSYTEVSQSGKGLHIICKGKIPGEKNKNGKFEIYQKGRFFALTGDLFSSELKEIKECQSQINTYYFEHIANEEKDNIKAIKIVKKYSEDGVIGEDFQKAVFETLVESNIDCSDYSDWLKLAMAFKSAGYSYDDVDCIFAKSSSYNYKQNKYMYERLSPRSITFATAYYYANQANSQLLKSKLPKKITIDENIPENKAYKNCIFEQGGKTYIVKASGKGDNVEYFPVEIAAFTMKIEKKIVEDNGNVSWKVYLETPTDNANFEIDGNVLGNVSQFTDAIMKRGCFLYNITDKPTHNLFIAYAMDKGNIPSIQKTQYLGMLEQGFLFHNALVKKNGDIVPIEKSGIQPPKEDKNKAMLLSEKKEASLLYMMSWKMKEILEQQTWKVLGFAVSTLFSDFLFRFFCMFPVLFLYGKKGTGKSSIGDWLSSLFGLHRTLTPFNINTTQKAIQRTGAKYKNCPVILNEFESTPHNIALVASIFDREGYGRATKDNSLDAIAGEINASFAIISTLNLTGTKAEDVQSRVVTVDSNQLKKNIAVFNWLQANIDSFSQFVPFCLSKINPQNLLEKIKKNINTMRELCPGCEERIIITHTILSTAYYLFLLSFSEDCLETLGVDLEGVAKEIKQQNKTTQESDLGQLFLNIAMALVRNGKIAEGIAKINKDTGKEIFIFSLVDILPFVREQGKKSELAIADEKTIANSLKMLGCENKLTRSLTGEPRKAWFCNFVNE